MPEIIHGRGWQGLLPFSKKLYEDTYFLPNENYDQWVERVSRAYQNDEAHGTRMMTYITNYWFHPSTPPSSNAGTTRGLPISCFTKSVYDDKTSIFWNYMEGFNLGAFGGGIGTDWSSVRELNSPVGKDGGTSSGIIPFLGISDRATLGISQGGLRRASEGVYLSCDHPEIEEFIDIRKQTGDQNRRCPNLHHGVVITDAFMNAVIDNADWNLISPKDNKVVKTVKAKELWNKILEVRATMKGEPYLLFIDTVNRMAPEEYKTENVKVTTSNLCTEITLRTDNKHSGVCCLASKNLEYWDEYQYCFDQFMADCSDYLDNVIQDFIDKTEGMIGFERARAGAIDERSLGFGDMGFHSLLQSKGIPFESAIAKGLNLKIYKQSKDSLDKHNRKRAEEGQQCPMSKRAGTMKRNIHVTAIAPTMSISSLCNVTSSGIEPWVSNAFTKKVKQGSFAVINKYLDEHIHSKCHELQMHISWIAEQWTSIKKNNGSVQHLEWMDQYTKDVFKTAFEIDQRWVIEHAGDRQPCVDQAQSINLFAPGGSHVNYIADLHMLAWRRGVKSLYYLRSTAINRASTSSNERKQISIEPEECLACQ